MKSVIIENKKYKLYILTEYGGNCVRLIEKEHNIDILRFPKNDNEMAKTPLLFGTPLLIPPNRISNGSFIFNGKQYILPLNEPEHNNHCHGELYHLPANVVKVSESKATIQFVNTSKFNYLNFPHECTLNLTYELKEGLEQKIEIINQSKSIMPFAVAFHTTFNLAFEGGSPENYSLFVPAECEFIREMKNYLPTGEIDDNFEEKKELNEGTYRPSQHFITKSLQLKDTECKIINNLTGNQISYYADKLYGYRHIFNGGSKELICIEPQTCRIDGLNVWKSCKEAGIIEVMPQHKVKLKSIIRYISKK